MEQGKSPVGLLIGAIVATGAAIGITVWALASRAREEEETLVELGLNLDPASASLGPGQIYEQASNHETQEVYIADGDFPLAPSIHNMHCLLKWNGREQRYPSGYRWYNTFEKP